MDLTQESNTLDLLFLIDITSSMIAMSGIKTKILEMVNTVKSAPPPLDGLKVRLGFISYHGFGVEPQFEMQEFTSSIAQFWHALDRLSCKTSSTVIIDLSAIVTDAIELATMFGWEGSSRMMIHIGDAPAGRSEFYNLAASDDVYMGGDTIQRDLKTLFLKLKMECQVGFGARFKLLMKA